MSLLGSWWSWWKSPTLQELFLVTLPEWIFYPIMYPWAVFLTIFTSYLFHSLFKLFPVLTGICIDDWSEVLFVFVCVHICKRMWYIYMCRHIGIYVYTSVKVYRYKHMCMHKSMYMHVCENFYTYICTLTSLCTCICVWIHVHVCGYVYIFTSVYICMHLYVVVCCLLFRIFWLFGGPPSISQIIHTWRDLLLLIKALCKLGLFLASFY